MKSTIEIIELSGNLTAISGINFPDKVRKLIKPGTQKLLLDLRLVSFVDSAGLSGLVRLYKIAQGVGIQLALCSISDQLAQLFHLTSMDSIFEIFKDRNDFYQFWQQEFPADAVIAQLDDFAVMSLDVE
ncbi:MAG TPA: STAS domain-containing protein [Leptolyngbyaceae cyanobacterium]